LFGLGRSGEVGGDDPWADSSSSLRDLFFPAPALELLDGEGFILQMHGVFTRIRSGAALVASSGGVLKQWKSAWLDLLLRLRLWGMEKL
jgi:hypothetical protein